MSFLFEGILVLLILASISIVLDHRKQIEYLSDPKNHEDIHFYISEMDRLDELQEEEDEKVTVGTNQKETKEEAERQEEAKIKTTEKMKRLKKEIPRCYVDSYFFYGMNQFFFVVSLLFTLFQAMTFNSCSDIPTLFLVLMIFATYAYRRTNRVAIFQYIFFVVYYI